jgi:hypothetical protein
LDLPSYGIDLLLLAHVHVITSYVRGLWLAGWQVGALWTGSRPRQFGLLPIEEEAGKG